jgi:wax ester synthase-like acyl-CoA acyltransferase family protein
LPYWVEDPDFDLDFHIRESAVPPPGDDRRLAETVLEATTARPPRTPFNGPISPHRRFAFGQLSLDAVRALKGALGFTVNDVVVALAATAVREWLQPPHRRDGLQSRRPSPRSRRARRCRSSAAPARP